MKVRTVKSLSEIRKLLKEGMKLYCESSMSFSNVMTQIDELINANEATSENMIVYTKKDENMFPLDKSVMVVFHTPQTVTLIPSDSQKENASSQMTVDVLKDVMEMFKNKAQLKIKIGDSDKDVSSVQFNNDKNGIVLVV